MNVMIRVTRRLGPLALLLTGAGLGLVLRTESLAHASGPTCPRFVSGEILDVRRIEGTGDIEVQQMSWAEYVSLDFAIHEITLSDNTHPTESLVFEEDET